MHPYEKAEEDKKKQQQQQAPHMINTSDFASNIMIMR